jgi:PAS domain S-box-containing protein
MAELEQRDSIMPPRSSEPLRVTVTGLSELLDLSPDALLIVDQAGTIAMANEQAAALFGYSREELRELRLEALLPESLRAVHTTHRQHYFTAPRTRMMGAGLHLLGRCKDGREFPVDISLRPVLLGDRPLAIAAVRDVSEQRRAEREREQQAAQLRLQSELIELSRNAILVRDPSGRILFWNAGAAELYGWTAQEALGCITHVLLKTRFPLSRADVDTRLELVGYWEGELVHTCRDDTPVFVESR